MITKVSFAAYVTESNVGHTLSVYNLFKHSLMLTQVTNQTL